MIFLDIPHISTSLLTLLSLPTFTTAYLLLLPPIFLQTLSTETALGAKGVLAVSVGVIIMNKEVLGEAEQSDRGIIIEVYAVFE